MKTVVMVVVVAAAAVIDFLGPNDSFQERECIIMDMHDQSSSRFVACVWELSGSNPGPLDSRMISHTFLSSKSYILPQLCD
jgi:hypothetical protein